MRLLQRTFLTLCIALMASLGALAQGPPPPPPPPPVLPPVPVPPGNTITPEKSVLGKILFWDEQLSSDNRMACGTCHRAGDGGGDPRFAVNPGVDSTLGTPDDLFGSAGTRRSDTNNNFMPDPVFNLFPQVTDRTAPTMINAVFSPLLFWDGRANGSFNDPQTGVNILPNRGALENQAIGPLLNGVEMAHDNRNWSQITAKLAQATPLKLASNIPSDMSAAVSLYGNYPALFNAAFGSPQISAARIAMAIATYQRTLISDQSPFDTLTLTPAQIQGLQTFNGAGRCNNCHTGALTTDNSFRTVGLRPPAEDTGRQGVTGNPQDAGSFKVPSLRNVGLRSRFMHNGQFTNLNQVLAFYDRGGDFNLNKDPVMNLINLPPNQRANLIDFLTNGLLDPRVANETFPFDRPTLASETNPLGSPRFGVPLAGSGGVTPTMLAFEPTNLGNTEYRLGVTTARGATSAFLLYSDVQAAPGTEFGGVPFAVDPNDASFNFVQALTGGSGVGDGYATLHFPIPNMPALAGFTRYVQWLIYDDQSSASWDFSASRGAALTVF